MKINIYCPKMNYSKFLNSAKNYIKNEQQVMNRELLYILYISYLL